MRYAVITGASGGLAKVTIKELFQSGYHVFALDIRTDELLGYPKSQCTAIECDVTDETAIQHAFALISSRCDALDVVINFAGTVAIGSVIEQPAKVFDQLLAVNLLGMYRVNQYAFPLVKKAIGRYINISSEYGTLSAAPFHAFYTSSKHAVEIYNDSLRREVGCFGIKVIKIRPGSFRTRMAEGVHSQFEHAVKTTKYYREILLKMKNMMTKELVRAKDPERFAKTIRKAITHKNPRLVYCVHQSWKMKCLSILPGRLQDMIYGKYFG
jgi:NAD(P)-dependent dehydrogenase (short-subunit alcohol dehydrogenase family)